MAIICPSGFSLAADDIGSLGAAQVRGEAADDRTGSPTPIPKSTPVDADPSTGRGTRRYLLRAPGNEQQMMDRSGVKKLRISSADRRAALDAHRAMKLIWITNHLRFSAKHTRQPEPIHVAW